MSDNPSYYGFRWLRNMLSPGDEAPIERKRVASAYQAAPGAVNVDINRGDPLKLVNDGTVALAAAGDAIWGIAVGFPPYYDGTKMVMSTDRLPGGTTYGTVSERTSYVLAIPVAGQIFEVDSDDNVTATTEAGYIALIEENCDISINAVAPKANPRLDISDHKTATAQVRIIDIAKLVTQDFSGNYVKLEVVFNEVQQAPFSVSGAGT